jgi:hypothetical protein
MHTSAKMDNCRGGVDFAGFLPDISAWLCIWTRRRTPAMRVVGIPGWAASRFLRGQRGLGLDAAGRLADALDLLLVKRTRGAK